MDAPQLNSSSLETEQISNAFHAQVLSTALPILHLLAITPSALVWGLGFFLLLGLLVANAGVEIQASSFQILLALPVLTPSPFSPLTSVSAQLALFGALQPVLASNAALQQSQIQWLAAPLWPVCALWDIFGM